jgi:hypothetical protein
MASYLVIIKNEIEKREREKPLLEASAAGILQLNEAKNASTSASGKVDLM